MQYIGPMRDVLVEVFSISLEGCLFTRLNEIAVPVTAFYALLIYFASPQDIKQYKCI